MKIMKILLSLVLSTAAVAPLQAQGTALRDAMAVMDKSLATFNSGNYTDYGTHISDDIVAYTGVYTPIAFEGKAKWVEFINGLSAYSSVTYDQRQRTCKAYGPDTVLCNAYFVFTTIAKDGKMEVQSGRETSALVRQGGVWKYASMHYSPMF